MAYARTPKSIRGYNIFKAVVALVLIAIIAALLVQGRPNTRTAAESSPTPTLAPATATAVPTLSEPTATVVVDDKPTDVPVEIPMLAQPEVGEDGVVTVRGTGTPGSTVELWANGRPLEQVVVGADGNWSLDVVLDPGEYNVSVRVVDADGTTLAESDHATFEVAAPPVKPPTLAQPVVSADGTMALRGTGTPGSTVVLWANRQRLEQMTVGADGRWSLAVTLDPGEYDLSARAVDADGKVLAESKAVKVVVEIPIADVPALTSPEVGETLTGGSVALAGTGEPGGEIEILDQGEVVGMAVVQADGTWAFAYDVDPGAHAIAVRAAGDEAISGETVNFDVVQDADETDAIPDFAAMEIDCGVDDAPEGIDLGDTYVVAPCEFMGLIAFRTGVALEDLLAANLDIEDPDLIVPGQIINLPPR